MTRLTPERELREQVRSAGGHLNLTADELCRRFHLPLSRRSLEAIGVLLQDEGLEPRPTLTEASGDQLMALTFTDRASGAGRRPSRLRLMVSLAAVTAIGAAAVLTALVVARGGQEEDPSRLEGELVEGELVEHEIVDGELTLNGRVTVANAEAAFANTVLDGSQYGATLRGVDDLIRLCRSAPDASYDTDEEVRTLRQVVEDGANTLRRHHPDLSAQLEQVADNDCR